MAYSLYTDIENLTGSGLGETILTAIIAEADREIDSILGQYGLSGSGDIIKSASIQLSIAGTLVRQRMDGKQPDSVEIGGRSQSLNTDLAIKHHRDLGLTLVDMFVQQNMSSPEEGWIAITNKR